MQSKKGWTKWRAASPRHLEARRCSYVDPNRGFRKQEPPQQRKDDRLKEGLEAGGLIKCVCKFLSEGLGIDPDGRFEIERAHRALATRPSADQPPRIVLI